MRGLEWLLHGGGCLCLDPQVLGVVHRGDRHPDRVPARPHLHSPLACIDPFLGRWHGAVAREGAGLSFFYFAPTTSLVAVPMASVDVPFMTIVLRKGYGLGAQAMAGGSFKAPIFTVSWPTGEFGGMGLEGFVKPRLLTGAPTSLTSNQFELIGALLANNEGLKEAMLLDRLGEFFQLRFVKVLTGLTLLGNDLLERTLEDAVVAVRLLSLLGGRAFFLLRC